MQRRTRARRRSGRPAPATPSPAAAPKRMLIMHFYTQQVPTVPSRGCSAGLIPAGRARSRGRRRGWQVPEPPGYRSAAPGLGRALHDLVPALRADGAARVCEEETFYNIRIEKKYLHSFAPRAALPKDAGNSDLFLERHQAPGI